MSLSNYHHSKIDKLQLFLVDQQGIRTILAKIIIIIFW